MEGSSCPDQHPHREHLSPHPQQHTQLSLSTLPFPTELKTELTASVSVGGGGTDGQGAHPQTLPAHTFTDKIRPAHPNTDTHSHCPPGGIHTHQSLSHPTSVLACRHAQFLPGQAKAPSPKACLHPFLASQIFKSPNLKRGLRSPVPAPQILQPGPAPTAERPSSRKSSTRVEAKSRELTGRWSC